MKVVYGHLLNYLLDKPSPAELSKKLFQLGHEHEINDLIFDIEFTPNRGDCLSLIGLARDLNVFYKTNLDPNIYKDDIPNLEFNFINKAKDDCNRISFLKIEINGETNPYQDYLENYFSDLNIKKKNFFTDISNYLAYEIGQPTHCYDSDLIGNELTLENKLNSSKFQTLLGKDISLKGEDLVFSSNENVVNLAGIVGGESTSCSVNTKRCLVECAYFKPESIVGKSIKYDIHSDASHKFERGVDPLCHEKVLRRFIQIVKDHAKIESIELYKNEPHDYIKTELEVDTEKVGKIIGIDLSKDKYLNILRDLGFIINKKLQVPSFRNDIFHQNDIAEEIARVIGYDNIPKKSISISNKSVKAFTSAEDKLKIFLVENGFYEVINSPFSKEKIPNSILIDNPLDSNRKFIRSSITESLVNNLIFNEKRQKDSIKFFEISDIYIKKNDQNLKVKNISLLVSGREGHNYIEFSKKLDKKYLKNLFKHLDINIDDKIIEVKRDKLNTKIKTPIYALEIDIEALSSEFKKLNYKRNLPQDFISYIPVSEYPSSYRDLSFSLRDVNVIPIVINKISNLSFKYLKNAYMFDLYENKKDDITKIGYRFIFQSNDKTLTDNEVDEVIENIKNTILSIDSIFLQEF